MILYHAGEWGGKGGNGLVQLLDKGLDAQSVLMSAAYAVPSWPELVGQLRARGVRRLFLDSGAFTAHHQGDEMTFDRLYGWIDTLEPDVYVQLDVIGDADGTRANLEQMRVDGYDPIPVFTRGAPWAHLERLLDEGADYIALGNISSGKGTASAMEPWLRNVFAMLYDRAGGDTTKLCRTHGFGVTTQKTLLAFPFYSVDSAAAVKAANYGYVMEPKADGTNRKFQPRVNSDAAWRHPLAFDPIHDRSQYQERRHRNAEALNSFAKHCTKVWAERGVVWPDQSEHPC